MLSIWGNSLSFYETRIKERIAHYVNTLQLAAESISKKTIADALDKSGASVENNLAAQKLLDEISLQLYTPGRWKQDAGILFGSSEIS